MNTINRESLTNFKTYTKSFLFLLGKSIREKSLIKDMHIQDLNMNGYPSDHSFSYESLEEFSNIDYLDMEQCIIENANISNIIFENINLNNLYFKNCNLRYLDLSKSNIQNITFEKCKMDDITIEDSFMKNICLINCDVSLINCNVKKFNKNKFLKNNILFGI